MGRIKSAEFVSMYLHNKDAHIAAVTMREYRSVIFQGAKMAIKLQFRGRRLACLMPFDVNAHVE